ncbi:MAG TPA: hypothetical protein VK015_03060, partial [Microbacterium sp.]|nr:hypothetical protein [Microbacterium sp.]
MELVESVLRRVSRRSCDGELLLGLRIGGRPLARLVHGRELRLERANVLVDLLGARGAGRRVVAPLAGRLDEPGQCLLARSERGKALVERDQPFTRRLDALRIAIELALARAQRLPGADAALDVVGERTKRFLIRGRVGEDGLDTVDGGRRSAPKVLRLIACSAPLAPRALRLFSRPIPVVLGAGDARDRGADSIGPAGGIELGPGGVGNGALLVELSEGRRSGAVAALLFGERRRLVALLLRRGARGVGGRRAALRLVE